MSKRFGMFRVHYITAFLDLYGDANVFAVDYKKIVMSINFIKVTQECYKVANYTAEIMDWIVNEKKLEASKIHFVGFSLGGQMTGRYYY